MSLSAPYDIPDTFKSAALYRCSRAHCGPPTSTRLASAEMCVGLRLWRAHSYPGAYTESRVPKLCVSGAPFARAYTMERSSRENGAASLSASMKYCL